MFKKILSIFVLICMSVSLAANAKSFTDVQSGSNIYEAVTYLSENGIINGYEDGSFKPDDLITRAEAAAIIVRAANLSETSAKTVYSDVPENHWAKPYIMTATENGIINGMGNGMFSPDDNVTYYQIIKMIVCMLGMEEEAIQKGGWPKGYAEVAQTVGFIDLTAYYGITNRNGSKAAGRGDVAKYIYNAVSYREKSTIYINNKKFSLGMNADSLATPDEILESTANFNWYVYGTDSYKNFYAIGVDNAKVVAVATTGNTFSYLGYKCGDVINGDAIGNIYTDSNDNNRIHSIKLFNNNYNPVYSDKLSYTEKQFFGESKMNFHFTNAFRVMHNLKPLKWSEKAAESAKLHSQDMAQNDYFSHTNQSGISSSQRMTVQGISWMRCGENIAGGGGRFLGFHSFDGWVNSAGHRTNMFGDFKNLGVGIAYSKNSTYGFYHTQNFYTGR